MATRPPTSMPHPWDLVSQAYADEVVPLFEPYARDALRLGAAPAGSRIVDVACGPGTLAFLAAEAGHRVDAIDFSPGMIERFEARRLTLGIDTVHAQLGDGQDLPFDDATFDAAFSVFGLMFYPDRAKGFRELRRVIVPNARAVVTSWQRLESNRMLAAIFGAVRETLGKVFAPGTAPHGGPPDLPLTTREACFAEMSEAFADVEVHAITHSQQYASARAGWESIARTLAPIALLRKSAGEDKWALISDAAVAAVENEMGTGEVTLAMPAWFAVGVAR